jgi:hypothetical protein
MFLIYLTRKLSSTPTPIFSPLVRRLRNMLNENVRWGFGPRLPVAIADEEAVLSLLQEEVTDDALPSAS